MIFAKIDAPTTDRGVPRARISFALAPLATLLSLATCSESGSAPASGVSTDLLPPRLSGAVQNRSVDHLRRCDNIAKHDLVHAAACNLALLMRTLFGKGTPEGAAGKSGAVSAPMATCARAATAARTLLAKLRRLSAALVQPARRMAAA